MAITDYSKEIQDACVSWCLPQKVVEHHNFQLQSMLFLAGAILLLFIIEFQKDSEKIKTNASLVRTLIYCYMFAHLMVIQWRLI